MSLEQFLAGLRHAEGVPYSGHSSTGAVGAYGLTGGFIKQWAPGAGYDGWSRAAISASPAAQDAIAGHAAQSLYSKYGNWRAVTDTWLTGSPGGTHAPGNMSTSGYYNKVLQGAQSAPAPGLNPGREAGALGMSPDGTPITPASYSPDGTPVSGAGNSLTQMTPEQAAEFGRNPDGTPLTAGGGKPSALAKLYPKMGKGTTPQTDQYAKQGAAGEAGAGKFDSAGGLPLFVTDISSAGEVAGKATKAGLEQVGTDTKETGKKLGEDTKDTGKKLGEDISKTGEAADKQLQTSTDQVTQAGTSWFDYIGNLLSGPSGLFARIGVGLLAMILIGFGLWMAVHPQSANLPLGSPVWVCKT